LSSLIYKKQKTAVEINFDILTKSIVNEISKSKAIKQSKNEIASLPLAMTTGRNCFTEFTLSENNVFATTI